MSRTRLTAMLSALLLMACALCAACAGAQSTQSKSSEYRLGNGDSVRVVVFQNPDLTIETRVTENGTITYPLVGNLALGGKTIPEAQAVIAKALNDGGYIHNPQVNIILLANRGNQVSVLGQVGKPGRYALETFTTRLSEMIAIAGGIGPLGADIAIVTGTRDGKSFRREIDIAAMFLDNKLQDDMVVAGGDVIFIQRQPTYYIYGEVQHPGSFRIERNMTVRQALAESGGLTARGTERKLAVFRRGANGNVERVIPNLNDMVQPDDVLNVHESLF